MNLPSHKGSLRLTHNEHRNYYQSAADFIAERGGEELDWAAPGQRERAVAEDSIWCLQWYPHTPVGSYVLYAADLDVLLDAAAAIS